jgi:hypothetical protein
VVARHITVVFSLCATVAILAPEMTRPSGRPIYPSTGSALQTIVSVPDLPPQSCPVTRPPRTAFVPPAPYPTQIVPDGFWYGTEKLWIGLPKDGTWSGLGHYEPTDTSYRQKLQWWRKGYNWRTENPPNLVVTGRRLDAAAPPLTTDEHANAAGLGDHASIMAGIFIPTPGCWQITGDYHGDKLTFVIWVGA